MAEITMTVRQIMNLGLWEKVCEYKGWSPYILREGLIGEYKDVTFDDTFEKVEEKVEQLDKVELIGNVVHNEMETQGHFWDYASVENGKLDLLEELLKYKNGQKVKITIEIID